ncbi:MAG TPA: NrfD/PsrC family molybdoenzyme membrane anchor subunit, partial [Planctomycetota bacterium]|nr:NrfD/PsrC family molybdoenzyme membrane anchor subunit [Planctomycetota bacterium]
MSNLPPTQRLSARTLADLPTLYASGIGWWLVCALLLGLVGLGGYAYLLQEHHGDTITGMRSMGEGGVPWGLYIMFDVYWVGVSFAAVTLAAVIRLFRFDLLKPLSRLSELVALISVMLGGCSVMADQGRPLQALINLPAYGRPASPFFGTFSMIMGGYLCASWVYFYLSSRADAGHCVRLNTSWRWVYRIWAMGFKGQQSEHLRHHRVTFWLSLIILPLIVIAYSTLGFVFGIQSGRPGWYSALQAPAFVVLAGVSGLGVLIVLAAGIRYFVKLEDIIQERAFWWLGNALGVLTLIYIYILAVEELTATYAAQPAETLIAREIVWKSYAPLFWTMVVSLVLAFAILFTFFLRKRTWIPGLVVAGILVNVAAILKRFLIIIPSQTHGMLLPYPTGVYTPTWIEYAVVVGVA